MNNTRSSWCLHQIARQGQVFRQEIKWESSSVPHWGKGSFKELKDHYHHITKTWLFITTIPSPFLSFSRERIWTRTSPLLLFPLVVLIFPPSTKRTRNAKENLKHIHSWRTRQGELSFLPFLKIWYKRICIRLSHVMLSRSLPSFYWQVLLYCVRKKRIFILSLAYRLIQKSDPPTYGAKYLFCWTQAFFPATNFFIILWSTSRTKKGMAHKGRVSAMWMWTQK